MKLAQHTALGSSASRFDGGTYRGLVTTGLKRRSKLVAGIAGLAIAVTASCAMAQDKQAGSERVKVGLIEINGALSEVPGPLEWLFPSEDGATLRKVVDVINKTAEDSDVAAIVIRLKDAELTASQVQELGAAIKSARSEGKKVMLFSEQYGTSELLLGSYADEVIAQSGSAVSFPGLAMEEMFLADTFAWAGLKADMVQVGDYKGANEMMTRSGPSPQWEENISQLLDGMYSSIRQPIMAGRKMNDAQLDEAMKVTWLADAEDAKKVGLIDSVIDLPDLSGHIEKELGTKITWTSNLLAPAKSDMNSMGSNPFAMLQMLSKEPDTDADGPTIAILHINGTIIDGESAEGGMFGGSTSVGSRTIRRTIEELAKDEDIKGVIVRIDSPGGSATASEVMWQGLRRLAAKKPVWSSVGGMAASGGYYLAVSSDKIYVNPSSIVGSIGVVGGKITMSGLYDHLKVNVVTRGRGPMATMFASDTAWTPQQTALVRAKMTETFDQFKGRVAQGRKGIDLSKTAGGWLFTGQKSIDMKMADQIGGLDVAIKDLAKELDLEDYEVMDYPGPRALGDVIQDALKGMVVAPNVGAKAGMANGVAAMVGPSQIGMMGREIFGPKAWPAIENAMNGMSQLRTEPVILMSPSVIYFK